MMGICLNCRAMREGIRQMVFIGIYSLVRKISSKQIITIKSRFHFGGYYGGDTLRKYSGDLKNRPVFFRR